jgi:hypothetical protein
MKKKNKTYKYYVPDNHLIFNRMTYVFTHFFARFGDNFNLFKTTSEVKSCFESYNLVEFTFS